MSEISRQSVLFFDASGDYTHVAEAVVPDFAQVFYTTVWQTGFPTSRDALPGVGLEGIERVDDLWDVLDRVDLVVFPDVGNVGLQLHLINQGMPVWGAAAGSRLEQDRLLLRALCQKAHIDHADGEIVHGIDDLRELLETQEDLYVKLPLYRGDMETFHHLSPFASKGWLAELALTLGPFGSKADFLVEQPIEGEPCVEVGFDGHCVDGEFPQTMLWGYEQKDAGYIGCIAELPEALQEVRDRLSPVLRAYRYRAPCTTEVKVCPQGNYLLDFTARFPCPPSELQTGLITNLAEIMWEGAHGVMVEPEYRYPYGAQLVLKSPWVANHALGLEIGRRDRVAIHGHCIIEGEEYAVSPAELEEFGSAFGMGNSVTDAMGEAIEAAESVRGHQVTFNAGALKDIIETIRTGKRLGLNWGKPRLESYNGEGNQDRQST